MIYDTHVNALNDGGNAITDPFADNLKYPFNNTASGTYKNKEKKRKTR